jgi:hypothetical protein
MTRFVAHSTPVEGRVNYAFDEGKDAGRWGMPATVTSGKRDSWPILSQKASACATVRGGINDGHVHEVRMVLGGGVRRAAAHRTRSTPTQYGEECPMTESTNHAAAHVKEMLADLSRLIEALDRRVPHLERLGEEQIARDAAELRQQAVSLIHRLEQTTDAGDESRRDPPRAPSRDTPKPTER